MVDVTNDPLGLTAEQRVYSDLQEWIDDLPERLAANRKLIEDLPPGSIVHVSGQPARTREQMLEVMW